MLLNEPLFIDVNPPLIDLNTVLSTEWRLFVERTFNTNIWIGRLELRETVGGSNIAIHGTNGTGSSINPAVTDYEAPKGFQGGGGIDGWFAALSETIGGAVLQFTFDTPRNIKQIAIRSPASATSSDLRSGFVQARVGGIWFNMAEVNNPTQFGTSETRTFSAYSASVLDVFAGEHSYE